MEGIAGVEKRIEWREGSREWRGGRRRRWKEDVEKQAGCKEEKRP